MSRIFISYRSADLVKAVAPLHKTLVNRYGIDSITLDKQTFVGGVDWLPQILAGVASAELIIVAIGPAWVQATHQSAEGPDYVREELALARLLKKPVLPVLLGIDPKTLAQSLPHDLTWLMHLHQYLHNPDGEQSDNELERAVTATSGIEQVKATSATTVVLFTNLVQIVQALIASILRPTGAAAVSLQEHPRRLFRSCFVLILSLVALTLLPIINSGSITLYQFGRFVVLTLITVTSVHLSVVLIASAARRPPSQRAIASFACHTSASLIAVLTCWQLALWIALPDEARQIVLAIPSHAAGIDYSSLMFMKLDYTSTTVVLLITYGGTAHLILIVNALAKAGAIVTGWKRWWALPVLATVSVLAIGVLLRLGILTDGLV